MLNLLEDNVMTNCILGTRMNNAIAVTLKRAAVGVLGLREPTSPRFLFAHRIRLQLTASAGHFPTSPSRDAQTVARGAVLSKLHEVDGYLCDRRVIIASPIAATLTLHRVLIHTLRPLSASKGGNTGVRSSD